MKLYKKDKSGSIRYWLIERDGNLLIKNYGVVGGEDQEHVEEVFGNTLRDDDEQAEERMQAKIQKRIENGYKKTYEDAVNDTENKNKMGLYKPMLAQRFDKVKETNPNESLFQYKYNGHRCMIANEGGELIAYSRNGNRIDTIPEILDGIELPDGETIDGELYCHNTKLQTITSWAKRRQENTKLLSFICYDAIMDEDYTDRLDFIRSIRLGDRALVAPVFEYGGSINSMLHNAIRDKYEGLIMRPKKGFTYEDGSRSKGLIKIKHFFDDEFKVTKIESSRDNWAILTCRMDNGNTFNVSAPGTIDQKRFVLMNLNHFIGKSVRVEYAELTKDGIPFHPIATGWRDKHNEL